jgi:F0F1-type ATP synthase membrane subunit c/vacuolar-type H+-ATPase subunit K
MQPIYTNPKVPTVEQVYRTSTVIWAAMLISQLLLVAVLYFAKPELFNLRSAASFPTAINPAVFILAFLGLATFAVSFVLKSRFLKLANENRVVGLVQTGHILAYALCEATSLFGLVAVFAFNFPLFFVWFVIGIAGVLLHFPNRDSFQAAAFTGIN